MKNPISIVPTRAITFKSGSINRSSYDGKDGFTLVELLVVITIVAVLGALVFTLSSKASEKAHRATCMGIIRQFGTAMGGYLSDNQNKLPQVQVNLQIPFYQDETDNHIFAKLYPYLGLETKSNPTALPDNLVCPAWRKRHPTWNSDGTGMGAGNAYFMNQDQAINGRRLFGTQDNKNPKDPYGGMSYALAMEGTKRTPAAGILLLADGHHPTEKSDPVHGTMRNCLFLDLHVESRPAKDVKLTISP